MQIDLAKTQAGTLREWASEWRAEARAGLTGGEEVAALLERAAKQVDRGFEPAPKFGTKPALVVDNETGLPHAVEASELRDG
jgi:hypothetical protein